MICHKIWVSIEQVNGAPLHGEERFKMGRNIFIPNKNHKRYYMFGGGMMLISQSIRSNGSGTLRTTCILLYIANRAEVLGIVC